MDAIFDEIYSRLLERGPESLDSRYRYEESVPLSGEELAQLRAMIEEANDYANGRLRADAKYLLFVNLAQMVLIPIAIGGGRRGVRQVMEGLREDIHTIVRSAEPDREGLVTGNAILVALGPVVRELNLSRWEFWG